MIHTDCIIRYKSNYHTKGILQQPGTRQIACLIALTPGYFVFKNENVKVKVKYSFVLHTGFAGSHLLFKHYHLLLDNK